jgi:hypothetical protein
MLIERYITSVKATNKIDYNKEEEEVGIFYC